jgi:Cof subfamily protein (haloacid dehalogenase superfamily)
MPIKLLALDIDGTLLNSRGELTPRTRARIEAARERGVLVALVTGRRFSSARQLTEELGFALSVPLVSHNGALTKNIATLETISFHPFELETAREVVRLGREHGVDVICCDDPHGLGVMVLEGVSPDNKALHRYLDKYRDSVSEVGDLLEYLDHAPIQIMFSGRCARMDDFAEELKTAIGEQVSLFRTRYLKADLTILDALSPVASKGDGLAAVAEAHGIRREEVMAVGDNHNDITMLRYAGVGVVMGNAEDELKQMGFALTASNEEDGVAEAIEQYILCDE